ncbi:MAG: hypothetical protein LBC90_01320, partial [Candidatus Adiutrix sp.]|nr:hypothetical protein [Candidatus Adiutrix sp.]
GYKCIVRVFCLVSMMAAGTSMAEDISQCPVDTVPIQIMSLTEPGYTADVTMLSRVSRYPAGLPGFPAFATAVTEHVAAKLAQEKLCLDNAESQDRSLLLFVPLRLSIPPTSLPRLEVQPSSGGCRIYSPWIDLAIERGPVPWVRGIVRWSERQLLADQAVLAGARNVPPGVAMPLNPKELSKYGEKYVKSEIFGKWNFWSIFWSIEKRVPPDILWLFRHSPQTTFLSFAVTAGYALDRAMKEGTEGYTKIVLALIDRCLASDGADIHYSSILDVADLIPLESYKIDTPVLY